MRGGTVGDFFYDFLMRSLLAFAKVSIPFVAGPRAKEIEGEHAFSSVLGYYLLRL
jgi:hypothetical protein